MISYLSGKILNKGKNYLILLAGDVGYKLFVNPEVLSNTKIGQSADFYTYEQSNEQGRFLYGLSSIEELEFFEMLVSVSGVGPKTALSALSVADLGDIKNSIICNNADLLNKVSGIGSKTAQRIILELKGKIADLPSSDPFFENSAGNDEIEALVTLGYSLNQVRQALREIDPSIKDSSERVKLALKKLAK